MFAKKYILPLIAASPDGYLLKAKEHGEQIALFEEAFAALESDAPGYEFIVRDNLSRICFFLYQQFESQIKVEDKRLHQDHLRTTKMLDYIHHHFAEDLTLTEIAALCGFDSPSNFAKMFKRFYNTTPREYRKLSGGSI
ncbi:MAG: AraC family transcriptional regulator [Lachnospiraceae bacterium]|nr:AraC family transcriptional regulator [Lachnospiraceae bacterium]